MALLSFQPIQQPRSDEELATIVREIDKIRPLLQDGLPRQDELRNIKMNARNAYEETADHDSIQYRKYDRDNKRTIVWKEVRANNGYVGMDDARDLFELQQRIRELLSLHSVDVQPTELFIPPNSQYTARFYIRNILSQATRTIDIKDDYLFSANTRTKNIDILWILQPYLGGSLSIGMHLLGSHSDPPVATISDIKTFLVQNPGVEIKGNATSPSGRRETHDRFIIIDSSKVYKIGASIKDLGAAQTAIDIVENPAVAAQYIQQWNNWWTSSTDYPGLV